MKKFLFEEVKKIVRKIVINEDYEADLRRAESLGFQLVEEKNIDEYKLFLVDISSLMPGYQIGLTSLDQAFFEPQSQTKTKSIASGKGQLSIVRRMKEIVSEWSTNYQPLYAGTYNQQRAYRYKSILEKLGFNIGEIRNMYGSYVFRIYAD